MNPPQQTPTTGLSADDIVSFLASLAASQKPAAPSVNSILSGTVGDQTGGMFQPVQAPSYDPGSIKDYARQQSDAMFGSGHWDALHQLINNESGWNPNAQNPTSTAYGLGQFLDSTWQGVGAQKTSDPKSQVDATLKYISNRYGDPTKALNFWENIAPTTSAGGNSHWY